MAQLRELRHVGKALYESPGSADQALEQLRKAHELVPDLARDRLNYGLALLRAGQLEPGMAELVAVQQQEPSIPHTYFNLGVEYKKAGDAANAIPQFEKMAELTPDEAKVHYNLGQLYRQEDRDSDAQQKFELAARLDPSLGAPHFQLYNLLRRTDPDRAKQELDEFQRLKKLQEETGLNEDVNWSFYSELYDPVEPSEAPAVTAGTSFEASEMGKLEGAAGAGIFVFDIDADKDVDAFAWRGAAAMLVRNEGGRLLLESFGEGVLSAAAGDPNNDGFPDVCLVGSAGAMVATNVEGSLGAAKEVAAGGFDSCLWHDFDHDNDDDLFLLGAESTVLLNAGGELGAKVEFPFEAGKRARAALAVELFEDNGNDLVVVYDDGVAVHQDRKLGRYEAAETISGVTVGEGQVRLEAVDFHNDGYLDLAVAADGWVTVLNNVHGTLEKGWRLEALAFADVQNRGWSDLVQSGGVAFNSGDNDVQDWEAEGLPTAQAAAAADFDGDGKIDLLTIGQDNAVKLARNRSSSTGRGLTISLTGVKSAKLAKGARVEVKAGPVYRKQLYSGAPMHVGVWNEDTIDTVRVTWPNGMIQNETAQPTGAALAFEEKPRLSGSCPMIFTWNGREFEYISEVLGVAPLGASLGGGKYFPVDHDEYVFLRGEQLVERERYYEVRITEELREVAYLDQIRLIALDRLADLEIYTNEKFKAPPFPEFRLYGLSESQKIRPRAARDSGGDVLERLRSQDGRYVDGFKRTFRNTAERHELILDFPELEGRTGAMLFLHGWVDWADASTIVAGSQTRNGGVQPPILQVRDAAGEWRTVIEDLGLPGGRPRTMAVDLSGKFLSSSREVRIVTNMCVYWDEIFAAAGVMDASVERAEPALAEGTLHFRGFSRNMVHPARLEPESFVYAEARPVTNWNPTSGNYTKFGAVEELLSAIDDRYVILGAGDEVALRFRAGLAPPKQGWTRDYLLFVDGWAKENDANTAFGDTVEPLPFHSMSQYPYGLGESFPDTAEHRMYRETYNNRSALRLVEPLHAR